MYILLYRIESDPANCHWCEYDTFGTIDAATVIMRAASQEYSNRKWKIVSPA